MHGDCPASQRPALPELTRRTHLFLARWGAQGKCAAATWVVAQKSPECTSVNVGALRYVSGALQICSGDKAWSAVSPSPLGKNAKNAGDSCADLKKAGVSTGSGLCVPSAAGMHVVCSVAARLSWPSNPPIACTDTTQRPPTVSVA